MKRTFYFKHPVLILINVLLTLPVFSQSPGGVSTGLTAWFKADALPAGNVTNWTTSGGSTAITLTDPSSPYAQSTNGGAAATNYFNYNQYVSFIGNSSTSQKNLYNMGAFALMNNDNVATSQSSFFGVYQKSSIATTNDAVVYWKPGTGNDGLQFRGWGRIAISANLGSSLNSSRDWSPDVAQSIMNYTGNRSSATSMIGQKNASPINPVTASNATGVTGISMGARLNGVTPSFTEYFAGNSSEHIFYNSTLPPADVTKVNTYLAIKFGVTLSSNYVSASNTTIFTNIAPYNNNIIGIGRDGASALVQRQSHNIDDSVRVYKGTLSTANAVNTEVFGADNSYIVTGANKGLLKSTTASMSEIPTVVPALYSRLEREWKVTNTNFNGELFNIDIKLKSAFPCYNNTNDLRLLVDDDGNFSDATVYAPGGGLSFSISGSVLSITGISNAHIPLNSTQYITVGTINTAVPSVSVAASATTICSGTSVNFTASPTLGGTLPNYQWSVNGSTVSTSPTFSTSGLNNGDVVSVLLTSNNTCVITTTANSNVVTMSVTNNVTPSVTSVASTTAICAGMPVSFTATPTNGGTLSGYQWQVNGSNTGTGSSTFSSTSLSNGDVVTVILTSNELCVTTSTANSNLITMSVTPLVTPAVMMAASNTTICSGTAVSFSATASNEGSAPIYQWQVNGINTGSNSSVFNSTTLNNGDVVTIELTSNETCVTTPTAISNTFTIQVLPVLTPALLLTSNNNNICAGTPVSFTATPTNEGTSPVYQWQVNGTNAGTNSVNFSSSSLNNGDVVSVSLTSNAICASPTNTISNVITMTVSPVLTPSVSLSVSNNTICAGTSVSYTATPLNGGTAPSYQWQVNGINAGTNSTTYISSTLTNGDVVSVVLTSNANCVSPANAASNVITMTVSPNLTPSVSIITSNNTICAGSPVSFTATPSNGGTTPVYQWSVNGANVGTNSINYTSSSLNNGDVVSVNLVSSITCASTPSVNSTIITMTVTPLITPSVLISASNTTICAGSPVSFTASPSNGGTIPAYQWQVNGANVGANSPFFNSQSINNGDLVTAILSSNANCASPTNANSNTLAITVSPTVTPAIAIAGSSYTICEGSTVSFTATGTNGGTSPLYQWQLNGANAGTNSPNFTPGPLSNNDVIRLIFTSNANCVLPSSVNSNSISISVYAMPIADFDYSPVQPNESDPLVHFQDQSTNATTWSWNFASLANSTNQNPDYIFPGAGSYPVSLLVSNGPCTSTVSKLIVIEGFASYYIPNTFTPNGDGVNDFFNIVGQGISANDFEMTIFNRWGGEVYKTNDITKSWNGKTRDGQDIADGTYTYIFVFKLTKEDTRINKVGHVTVFK